MNTSGFPAHARVLQHRGRMCDSGVICSPPHQSHVYTCPSPISASPTYTGSCRSAWWCVRAVRWYLHQGHRALSQFSFIHVAPSHHGGVLSPFNRAWFQNSEMMMEMLEASRQDRLTTRVRSLLQQHFLLPSVCLTWTITFWFRPHHLLTARPPTRDEERGV